MKFPAKLSLFAPLLLLLTAAAAEPGDGPRYNAAGDLIPPADYREWIFLSAGIDMSYSDRPAMADGSMFDNVFVDRAAWRGFTETGHWPDKAMFVLESRNAASHGSINRLGHYQTDVMGTEIHVHDEARFQGGWGFFALDGAAPAKLIPYKEDCYACHQAHGAVDTTFTQFYPTAKPIAEKAGTYQER